MDFEIQTDPLIQARSSDLVKINKKQKKSQTVEFQLNHFSHPVIPTIIIIIMIIIIAISYINLLGKYVIWLF